MSKLSETLIAIAILLLPLDNFPIGKLLLREFGARPTNVFLLIAAACLVTKLKTISFTQLRFVACTLFVICLGLINFFSANIPLSANVIGRMPEVQWALQTLMFTWMLASVWIWTIGFRNFIESKMITRAFIISIYVSLYFFVDDLTPFVLNGSLHFPINQAIQSFFGGDHDLLRPAGLCSEPSIYASWVLIAWPLTLLLGEAGRINKFHSFALCTLLIATAIGSTSRTFIAVLLIQLPIIGFFVLRKFTYEKAVAMIIVVACSAALAPSMYSATLGKVASIFDASKSLSTLSRNSGKETAYLIFSDYPIFGVGSGQFSSYYRDYVPSKYMASHEVERFIRGESDSRMSTFNLPARLFVEQGFFGAILLLFTVSFCIFLAPRSSFRIDLAWGFIFTSLLGGLSFYFQQDQYGYQPGLMSISLALSLRNPS